MMDHPEPISKRPAEIPQCRKGFSLDEARSFVDQVMEVFRGLEDMTDLRSMYETGKQLSRAYFDCHLYRQELAQHLTSCDYPAFASKMMKKLNNMGVFKNDDIWFSSFYFYNTTWNFSDIWPEFASALAAAGLPNLLNLNIGHQPYLENLNSKNVYYLIKASLSIIHNIARVPGNSHYFSSESVRQALVHLSQREEDFLRSVSTLCLAHIVTEPELPLLINSTSGAIDLLRILVSYVAAARVAEKRRYHGFQVIELLDALCALSVLDPIKQGVNTASLDASLTEAAMAAPASTSNTDQPLTCLNFLKDLLEIALLASPSAVALREAEEAIRILWNISFDPSTSAPGATSTKLKSWFTEVLANPSAATQLPRAMIRAMEATHWKLTHSPSPSVPEPTEVGPILFSFAPSNRSVVSRIADRVREGGMSINNLPFNTESYSLTEASAVGMSMCGANAGPHQQWLDCVDQASVIVVCLSDAYRLSPGCRYELERFLCRSPDDHNKPVVVINLQPKFKPTGWLSRALSKPPIEFNSRRDMDASCESLVKQLKELMVDVKKRSEAALLAAHRHQSVDSKSHAALAGDTGRPEVTANHLGSGALTGSRAPSGMSAKREEVYSSPRHCGPASKSFSNPVGVLPSQYPNQRPIPTGAWRHVVRPEVRNWSTGTVANWLKFRGLGHVPSNLPGGIDGILLSQLAGLRLWAPDYFTQSLNSELGLTFAESLRFLEALDELAPEEDDLKKLPDDDDAIDGHAMVNTVDGTASRP